MRAIALVFCLIVVGCQTTDRDRGASSVSESAGGGVTVETCAIDGRPFVEVYNGADYAVIRSLGVDPPTIVRFGSDGSLTGQIRNPKTAMAVSMIAAFRRKIRLLRDSVYALEPETSELRSWVDANVQETDQLGELPQASAEIVLDVDGQGRPAGTFTVTGGAEFADHLVPPIRIPVTDGLPVSRFPLRVAFSVVGPKGKVQPGAKGVACSSAVAVAADAVPVATMATTAEGKQLQEQMHMMAAASADLALSIGYLLEREDSADAARIERAARLFCAPFSRIAVERYKDPKALEKGTAEFLQRHPAFSQWRAGVEQVIEKNMLPPMTLERALWNGCAAAARPDLRDE